MPLRKVLVGPFEAFVRSEAKSALLLIGAALSALIWSNLPASSYDSFWTQHGLDLGWGMFHLRHVISDGFMSVFFLLVGLEIKREFLTGELATRKRAMLPIVAAIGGMAVPALIYWGFNLSGPEARGWAVPMATDIAFALGVITLLGNRVPTTLKVFLTAIAIVDDLGAVTVIALFFTQGVDVRMLGAAAAGLAMLLLLNRMRVNALWAYLLPGVGIWLAILLSGVHATVAGVLVAFCIPAKSSIGPSPLERLEHALNPIVSYAIVPLFALANAGVVIRADTGGSVLTGVAVGLLLGKPIGIGLATLLAVKLRVAVIPAGVTTRMLLGASVLAGIGFTMSLFIGELAFRDGAHLAAAKLGIVAASISAGVIGYAILRRSAVQSPERASA